jgi:2-polyprenyl-6-methoxyphenol hydroxylase-like FAD-dependent oxidoreductase
VRGGGVRVLVVGAGIAGLAAAGALRRWGASVEVVDRLPAATPRGAGIYLPGNAVRMLDTLGWGSAVRERAVPIGRQRTADHRGRLLFDVDAAELWAGVGPCLALSRADLHHVLLADPASDAPVRWGCGPRAVASAAGGVAVAFDDGTSDHYDLVVGADGAHSTVRDLFFPAGGLRPVGQHARRFLVPAGDADDGDPMATWSLRLGPRSAFLTIPVGNGALYCYCDGPVADPPTPLRELFADFAEPVPTLLDDLDTTGAAVHSGPIEEVVLDRWSRDGVLLIGDAAHATSPNLAQGAAMALEDACVLAEELAGAGGLAEALTAYEHRRRPRTGWVRAQTHRRDRARYSPPSIRNTVLTHLGGHLVRAHYRPLRARP